jgi:hypothetical protein
LDAEREVSPTGILSMGRGTRLAETGAVTRSTVLAGSLALAGLAGAAIFIDLSGERVRQVERDIVARLRAPIVQPTSDDARAAAELLRQRLTTIN